MRPRRVLKYGMDGLLAALLIEQLPHRFVVHFWNKDVGRVGSRVDDARRISPLGVQFLLLLRSKANIHTVPSISFPPPCNILPIFALKCRPALRQRRLR